MQVRIATEQDQQEWDQYVLAHSEGVAYQLFAWKQAVEIAYGYESFYLLAESSGGVCGVLPLIIFKRPFLGTSYISLPYCDAGGVLADNEEVERVLLKKAFSAADQVSASCQIRSINPLQSEFENSTEKVRMVYELPECAATFMASLKSKLRTKIKKPLKSGYIVKSGSSELIDPFYIVFAENMHHLGSPVHSRSWIEAIFSTYRDNARIFVVFSPDDKPVAAAILLFHRTTVSNPLAASLHQYNHMKPNMLLYSELISYSAEKGYKKFDFGRSTPGEGTYVFKEQWGARPQQLCWYDYPVVIEEGSATGEAKDLAFKHSKREFAAQLWQKMPAVGVNWLGPKIRKYISL